MDFLQLICYNFYNELRGFLCLFELGTESIFYS